MDKIRSYEDLRVYEQGYSLVIKIYQILEKIKDQVIANQIKRSSLSIPLNIAEGYARRKTVNDFKYFIRIAIGSCNETKVLLKLMQDIHGVETNKLVNSYDELGRQLNVLHETWR